MCVSRTLAFAYPRYYYSSPIITLITGHQALIVLMTVHQLIITLIAGHQRIDEFFIRFSHAPRSAAPPCGGGARPAPHIGAGIHQTLSRQTEVLPSPTGGGRGPPPIQGWARINLGNPVARQLRNLTQSGRSPRGGTRLSPRHGGVRRSFWSETFGIEHWLSAWV